MPRAAFNFDLEVRVMMVHRLLRRQTTHKKALSGERTGAGRPIPPQRAVWLL